ncbi:MAG: alanyl-tRNA editing protein, partial [Candidatus Diapherotrites archaeon]|nr:alanyl-tRNA editing protein [Candidatus Diapherotrites archaeon]
MTQLLYLTDSYMKEFSAKITQKSENFVAFDHTAFYPAGGGQPSDCGKIFAGGKEFEVIGAKKDGENVFHKLNETNGLEMGEKIVGKIDWDKRYKLMRMHTCAHVLAAVIFAQTGKLITGNQIGWPESRMDFDVPQSFDLESIKTIGEKVNQELLKNHEVTVYFLPRGEALKNPLLFRLKEIMPPDLQEWRIVKIGGIDLQ